MSQSHQAFRVAGPVRGEVWWVDFSPTRGHEQAGSRPSVVLSATSYNQGPAELAVVVPMTTTPRGIPLHILVTPPDGGVKGISYAMCDQVRCVSLERFDTRLGYLSARVMADIEFAVRTLLEL
jgi:mRNA interferase MazF